MNNETHENNLLTRRSALRVIGVGVVTSSTALVAACSKGGDKPAPAKAGSGSGHAKKAAPAKAAEAKPAAASKPAAAAEPAKAGGACADPAKLDQQSKTMRSTLQYVEKSVKEGQNCSGCLQWIPGAKADACGGCKLFSGGVNPKGYCLSWAKKAG